MSVTQDAVEKKLADIFNAWDSIADFAGKESAANTTQKHPKSLVW